QRLETRLDQKEATIERKQSAIGRREHELEDRAKELQQVSTEIEDLKKREFEKLEELSGISSAEARKFLLDGWEDEVKEEGARHVRQWEAQVRENADRTAHYVLATAIQRCTADVVSETTVSSVALPSDEMKGRLIGREGRNIRALEQATGVDLIIDDTPEVVTISSFAPVRREIARIALNKLILDGRIHPARIEEVVERAKAEVDTIIKTEGENAAYEATVPGLHPELIKLIGQLKYRTSYGQNVLQHSLEVAHLSGMIAAEIGADASIARRAGLLHDIGKAVDYEVQGSHATIGANLVRQWDKSEEVAQAVGEHHGEAQTTSTLGFIISAADAISGSRQGARRESLDHYLKRIHEREDIATGFSGVEKAYAIQAGREVRVLVKPEDMDDLGTVRLARDISKKIEECLTYPGQIRVVVARQTTAIEYAK
ncbi:MAG: ribonuclease Y, partial [Dehalococcoidia bacterium]|nr:ribonuclease Y [Dehalococcoidia bacterium]